MDRCKELEAYIEEYRIGRKNIKKSILEEKYTLLISTLFIVLDDLIQEQAAMQESGEQDRIKYLIFQYLRTSAYTGSYEMAVSLSNSALYLDENMISVYWRPELIYENIDKDMEEVRQKLNKKYVRIEEYELLHIKQELLSDDWELFTDTLGKMSDQILSKIAESTLLLEDEIQILCGAYMDKLDVVHKVKLESCQEEKRIIDKNECLLWV